MREQDGTEELKRPAVLYFLVNTTNIIFILNTVTKQKESILLETIKHYKNYENTS